MTEQELTETTKDEQVDLKHRARSLAQDASKELLDKANESGSKGFTKMGSKLDEAADYLRDRAPEAASKLHIDSRHVDAVADKMHTAAGYLQQRDPRSVLGDLDRSIQQHPYRALLIGAGLGYVLGRLFRRD